MRHKSKHQKNTNDRFGFIPYAKTRKHIETDCSQFVDQFMLNRNYAKQIEGFITRIISKISAFTFMQYVNYSLGKTYWSY